MRCAKIALQWFQKGSASHSSRCQRFVLPARFDHQGDGWKEDAWSLIIELEGIPNKDGRQNGLARFLMPSAPHNWLVVGAHFTIFEGELALANGKVEEVEEVFPE